MNPDRSEDETPTREPLLLQPGDAAATVLGQTSERLYEELRRLARLYMRRERREHTLDPTALANEAFLRLASGATVDWESRSHFLAIAARAMRSVLVDHARRRSAQKRGGGQERIPLTAAAAELGRHELDLLELDEALDRLAALDPRKAQVVVMRFYSGMSAKEIGLVLEMAPATVQRHWYAARAWLRVHMGEES